MVQPDDLWQRWVCAQCGQRIQYMTYRKHREKPGWVHVWTESPWCPKDKQHGPKTRYVVPVPSILVIKELADYAGI